MNTVVKPLSIAALLLASLVVPTDAVLAGTIYPDTGDGSPDRQGAQDSDVDFNQQVANAFSLQAGASTITDIHWWGFYFNGSGGLTLPDPDQFSFVIYEDNSGSPSDTPMLDDVVPTGAVTRTQDGAISGIPFYAYSVDIEPYDGLVAGDPYWLTIFNDTRDFSDPSYNWLWATADSSTGTGQVRVISPSGSNWSPLNQEFAFNLTNDNLPSGGVPVPGSLLLMVPGLLLVRRYSKM